MCCGGAPPQVTRPGPSKLAASEHTTAPEPTAAAPIDLSQVYCKADGQDGAESPLQPPLRCAGTVRARRGYSVAEARQLADAPELAGSRLLLDVEGYVAGTSFDAAPACAWHLPHEPEPVGCHPELPRLWLCDAADAPREKCLEVSQFASSFANLRAAQLWNAQLSQAALKDQSLRYFDSVSHQLVPFPLPVRGSHLRFSGTLTSGKRGTLGPLLAQGSFELQLPTPLAETLPASTPAPTTRAELWPPEAWIIDRLSQIPDCKGARVQISAPLTGHFIWTNVPARYYEITCNDTPRRPTLYAAVDESTRRLVALGCHNDTGSDWSWRCGAEHAVLSGQGKHPDVLVVLHSGCSPTEGCRDVFEVPFLTTEVGLLMSDELLAELDRIKTSRLEPTKSEVRVVAQLSCSEEDPLRPTRPGCVMTQRYRIRYRGEQLVLEHAK